MKASECSQCKVILLPLIRPAFAIITGPPETPPSDDPSLDFFLSQSKTLILLYENGSPPAQTKIISNFSFSFPIIIVSTFAPLELVEIFLEERFDML